MADIEVSVVIPVYRSAGSLVSLTQRLVRVLDDTGRKYEIIFVEDGGPDDSWHVLCDLHAKYQDSLVTIQLMRNFGQHNALMCGFRHARGRYIVTMDDDLQNPPEEIPKLIQGIEEGGFDLVYGTYETKRHSLWRNAGSCFIRWLYRFAFKSAVDITSFRIMRRELVGAILQYDLNYSVVDGLLAWNTQRVGAVTVDHDPRQHGRSGYSMRKLLVHAISVVTNFSLLPLQIASVIGFVAAIAGFTIGAYYVVQHFLSNITVPGYASTITAILVLGGLQLLSIGVIGEYLGRLHLNVNRKPQYTVRSVARTEEVPGETTGSNDRIE